MTDESFIISVSGSNSNLKATFFPPIELNPEKNYVIGFCSLHTWNSIPNIYSKNNSIDFKYGDTSKKTITLPIGTYELDDLAEQLRILCAREGIHFSLIGNENTLKCTIRSENYDIDFKEGKNSIRDLLGFEPDVYRKGISHVAQNILRIFHVNTIKVECSIASGSFFNDRSVHTLHEFFPKCPATYKIIEDVNQIIYIPITDNKKSIDHIEFTLVDQNGDLVDFRNETICLRAHIKAA